MEPESSMGMWSKDSSYRQTQLCDVSAMLSASIFCKSRDELRLKTTPDVACLFLSVFDYVSKTVRTENEIQEVKPERKQE
jgi:hypothetical protein